MITASPRFDVLIREPAEVYHSRSGEYLSSHLLAAFRECPLLYRKKRLGLIKDEDRPAYLLGRAAHTLILEGTARFEAEYAIGGPVNPRTGKTFGATTKAFARWAHDQGRPVLTDEQAALVASMAASVKAHEQAQRLLAKGVAERVVRALYMGLPCQIRIDWFSRAKNFTGIVDLKTCDGLSYFEADARRYGYIHQLAFYRVVLCHAIGEYVPMHIIAVEKKEPFRCGVWRIGENAFATARKDNERALAELQHCIANDVWPTGYEEVRTLDDL